jgi:hypothetical protein
MHRSFLLKADAAINLILGVLLMSFPAKEDKSFSGFWFCYLLVSACLRG